MEEIYEHIKKHIKEKGFPPSGKQIAEAMKRDYDTEVKPKINRLIHEGKIKVDEVKENIIEILE